MAKMSLRSTLELFRRHVAKRTYNATCLSQTADVLLQFEHLGQSEIQDLHLDCPFVTVLPDDVFGLQIAMDDAPVVGCC